MVNIKELERKWLRYKIKSYLPFILVGILSLGTLSGFLFTHFGSQKVKTNTPQIQTLKTAPTIKKEKTLLQTNKPQVAISSSIPQKKKEQVDTALKPSLEFLQKMQHDEIIPKHHKRSLTHQKTIVQKKLISQKKQEIPKIKKPPLPTQQIPQETKISTPIPKQPSITKQIKKEKPLHIKTKHISESEMRDIIQRFKRTNNPNLSLFIAKKYYDMGKYNKAYNYALITNQIDNTMEESWIIFTKSLVKMGYKQRAIKTLKAYIDYSHSNNAKLLLSNIIAGKFK